MQTELITQLKESIITIVIGIITIISILTGKKTTTEKILKKISKLKAKCKKSIIKCEKRQEKIETLEGRLKEHDKSNQ